MEPFFTASPKETLNPQLSNTLPKVLDRSSRSTKECGKTQPWQNGLALTDFSISKGKIRVMWFLRETKEILLVYHPSQFSSISSKYQSSYMIVDISTETLSLNISCLMKKVNSQQLTSKERKGILISKDILLKCWISIMEAPLQVTISFEDFQKTEKMIYNLWDIWLCFCSNKRFLGQVKTSNKQ